MIGVDCGEVVFCDFDGVVYFVCCFGENVIDYGKYFFVIVWFSLLLW